MDELQKLTGAASAAIDTVEAIRSGSNKGGEQDKAIGIVVSIARQYIRQTVDAISGDVKDAVAQMKKHGL